MATTPISHLKRYWDEWENKLNPLVKDRGGARLFFSTLKQESPAQNDGYFILSPVEPICLYNAPPKASSSKSSSASTKLAIFIDGDFHIYDDSHPKKGLRASACSVMFYQSKETADGINLTLFDALHFDHEIHEGETAYHPVFHAQRGISRTVNDGTVRSILSKYLHCSEESIVINNEIAKHLGSPYLRLPTPQLDLFSALTLIAADFFCNGGDQTSSTKEQFQAILNHLRNAKNSARLGHTAAALKNRITNNDLSIAHWYVESA